MKTTHRVSGSVTHRLPCFVFALRAFRSVWVALLLWTLAAPSLAVPQQSATTGPKIWLADAQSLRATHVAARPSAQSVAQSLAAGQGQPLSMANGDFDADGVEDLVVGYATPAGGALVLHRGNLDAFAPQSEASFQAIAHGQFPRPFLEQAQVIDVPIRPDFIVVGNFAGQGNVDLVAAARGGNALYIFANDGKGNFGAQQVIQLRGAVTALAAGDLRLGQGFTNLLVGTSGPGSSSVLLVLGGSGVGLGVLADFPVSAPASNIAIGEFGDASPDAAFLVGDEVFILRSSAMQVLPVSLPFSASALALGSFLYDRNGGSQIALLGSDGVVHIAVRNEFDPRVYTVAEFNAIRRARLRNETPPLVPTTSFPTNGWKIVDSIPIPAAFSSAQRPIFFRTRISDQGADDLMALSASTGQLAVISHPDAQPGKATLPAGQVSLRPYSGSAILALPVRTNIDGRQGLVALHAGETDLHAMMPLPDPTFSPNRFDDPTPVSPITNACNGAANDCSLREAILRANATAGTDTIMLAAGTYTLSLPKVAGDFSGNHGALYVNDSLNIVGQVDGSGNPTSIIQAGTTAYNAGTANGVDMVMAVNEDISPITNATASISNVILQNGHNRGTSGNDGDGGCMEFDTGSSGAATLTLTNVILQNCDTTQGSGGGLANFNFVVATGTGQAIISNSTIQGNSVADNSGGSSTAAGGGIWVSDPSRMTMTNSRVLNNLATKDTATTGIGGAGGLLILSKGTPGETPQTQIHSSIISGNQASFAGGGITDTANLLIDQGTIIAGNKNGQGASGTHVVDGGGIFANPSGGLSVTLSKVTVTNNTSTGTGGGISTGAGGSTGSVTINFSRFVGNTAGTTGSNLENLGSADTVTNNWWGTNVASSTIHITAGTTTFDPFIVLTHTSSPQTIRINQSATLTGDMSKDNHGNGAALSGNLDEIVGLPITFNGANLGSIPQAQPETLGNPVPTATATFNAGNVGGVGTANATVDQAVVAVNSNLIASATESGSTVTITTVGAHGFSTGQFVSISGVGVGGYDGQFFPILSTPTATTFTYTANISGLGASSGGTATTGIVILQPPSISKSFGGTKIVPTNTPNTLTFSITNPNVVPINASFTDNLPTNGGTVPGSLVVASTPNVVNNCGGTVTATAGASTISFSNSALAAGSSPCTIAVNVQSAVDNIYNNSVTINSTDAGNGNTASDTLNVINPPHIVKAFGATTIPLNGTTSLTFTVNSTNQNQTLSGISFTDTLPNGAPGTLVVATPNGLINTCSTTPTATAGSGTITLTGASLAAGASCTINVNVQGTVAGFAPNSVTVSDAVAGTGNTSSTSLTVVAPPTISKSFSPKSVPLGSNSTLSFTVTNPNTGSALSGVAFTDTLPGGLKLASTTVTGSCGSGTITATINNPPGTPSTVSLSGGTLTASPAAGSSCTFSVSITGISAGAQVNTTSTVSSTEGGTGGTATDSITVVAPPSIAKAFSPTTVPLNGTSTLTFTVTNPAANTMAEAGVAFSDTLPIGLVVATPNGLTNSCGGTPSATAGGTSISLTGGSIATNTSCTVVVNVTGFASGQYTNTTGAVSSTNGGTGNTASANLTVASPPTITKSFNPTSIGLNTNSTLSFTIQNPNTGVALSGVAFTDSLPAGLVVAATPNVAGSCGSGTITAVAGSGTIGLSGGTLTASPAAGSSCTFSVAVTGTTAGVKNNTVQASSNEGGTGNTSNATLTVVAPPSIAKAFSPNSIPLNGTSALTFTISNPSANAVAEAGVAFSDTLPTGLVVATPNVLANSCGGTPSATAGGTSISLTGGSIAASSSCAVAVNVQGTTAGSFTNTSGAVSSTNGGTGNTATANLTVVAPPTTTKVFNPTTIAVSGTSTMTITITNPSATVGLTGVGFTDTFPANLAVAVLNGLSNTCNGTPTATAVSGTVSLTGGTIAANSSCAFTVNVIGAAGTYLNSTGPITSTEGGNGAAASGTLTVANPPTITKLFGATSIPQNGTTSLSFSITNPNSGLTLTGLTFTDSLPSGLVVATPSNLNSTCTGTATALAGAGSASLSGATLAAGASCAVSLNVQGTTAGLKNNIVQASSNEGGTSIVSNASITVVAPPAFIKAFGAASIPLGGSTLLSFAVQNNNAFQVLSGIGFTDTLPTGLTVASPNGLIGSCGGTITATQGTNLVSLSGASLAASTSCSFSVNVTGTAAGSQNNTTSTVTSTQGGTGAAASANLTVVAPPSIAKAFNPTSIAPNGVSTLTFTIANPSANTVAEVGVTFFDTLPAGLVVATPNGLTNTCGGTAVATAGTGTVALFGGTVATSASCTVSVNVTGSSTGSHVNTTGPVSSTNGGMGGTASATLNVALPPAVTKAFGAPTVPVNGTTSLTITITNPNTTQGLSGLAFADSLPPGLVVAATPNLTNTCGGTATATATSASLTAGTLAGSASCAVSLNVTTGSPPGVLNNIVIVTSTNAGTSTANATLTVTSPPVLSKSFGATSIPLGGSTSLSFKVQNNNATQSLSGIAFTDTLPTGLTVASPNGLIGSCGGGTITAGAGTNAISLSGATLAGNSSCAFSATVTGTAAGQQNNTTSAIASNEGGNGAAATASLSVVAPPAIAKAFNPASITPNTTTSLTFTISNPAANTVALTGVGFTDTLPTGLTVASSSSTVCGGTLTTTAPTGIALSGATINNTSPCQFSVTVTGVTPGSYTNTSGNVTSTNGGTGNTASASLVVALPPAIAKAFGASSIGLGASTSLSFTINNPNTAVAFIGVAFTDTLPAGLSISTPNGLTGTCGSGTITAAAGSSSVTLAGGGIAASGSCTFGVNVTGVAAGNQVNTTGNVSATNGGTGNTATASITVLAPDLTITKTHTGNFFQGQAGATYSISVSNAGQGPTAGTVTVTEAPPAGLSVTSLLGSGWSCAIGTLICTRTDALAAGASYPPITVTVNVATNAAASVTNVATVGGGGELNLANDSASDLTTITAPPDFTVAVAPTTITIRAGQTATFNITITPVNNAFSNAITISATGLPPKSQLAVSPPSLTPGANPATGTVVIMTSGGDPFLARNSQRRGTPVYAMLLPLAGLLLSGLGLGKQSWRKGKGGLVLFALMLLCGAAALNGCASASNFRNLGTPPGTYSVSITATSGNTQHAAPATLVVQP